MSIRFSQLSELELKQIADSDDVQMLFNLANYYFNKKTSVKNEANAFMLYRKSAQQGHAESQNNLGVMYASGVGTEMNPHRAVYWYKKSATQGYSVGMVNFAKMLLVGEGITKDKHQAKEWLEKAAAAGNQEAKDLLAQVNTSKASIFAKGTIETLVIVGILPWAVICTLFILPLLGNIGVTHIRIGLLVAIILILPMAILGVVGLAFGEEPEIPDEWRD